MNTAEQKDKLFRRFQTDKPNLKKSVPTVSMTVDICADNLEIKRKTMNSNSATKISVTHILIKVVPKRLGNLQICMPILMAKNSQEIYRKNQFTGCRE